MVHSSYVYTLYLYIHQLISHIHITHLHIIPLHSAPYTIGALPEDHREERVPGAALGAVHHHERPLPTTDELAYFYNVPIAVIYRL